jgi:hypothetical protein
LGYLHESKLAQSIATEWFKPDGLLGDVTQMNEFKRQMFENVAPVNQRAALDALLRGVTCKDFISISNNSRAYFARLLRSLAYEQVLFEEATRALLLFVLEEPEDYKENSNRDILQSLFSLYLSGTQALSEQRASFVRSLAFSGEDAKEKLALNLLRSALNSHHFSSHYSFDFGALKRDYGWHPKNLKEVQKWFGLFVDIAVEIGKSSTARSSDARGLLGGALRGLWVDTQMHKEITSAARELAAIDGWPDGWIGIKNTLHWDKNKLDETSLEALNALEKELAPRDLLAKIRAKVLSRGAFGVDIDDDFEPEAGVDWYDKKSEVAQALGKLAALDDNALADLASYISKNSNVGKVRDFGFGVGQAHISVQKLLYQIRLFIKKSESTTLLMTMSGQ